MKNTIWYIILIIFTMSGCKNNTPDEQLTLRDVWMLEQAQINSFDPIDAYHNYHIQLVKQLFNTLTDTDNQGKIIPSLAVSWESENGKDWVFHLRNNVWFADDPVFSNKQERKLIADDVKYTFERLLNPKYKSLGISYFLNISGVKEYMSGVSKSISGIKAIDDSTISFHLIEPDYNFQNLLSLPYCSIVKKKAIEKYDSKQHPVGTGPFILKKYVSNESVSLIKNYDYWEMSGNEKLPFINKVEIKLTTDYNYSFSLFKNQKIDFLELDLPLIKQLESSDLRFGYKKDICESVLLNFYLFNLNKIKNAETRRGISYAIDRSKMQQILGDNGVVTKSLYPSIFKDIAAPNSALRYDPEEAKKNLVKPMNIKLVSFEDILSRRLANQIKEDLKKYFVNVEIESVPFPVLVERLTSGNYDMIQIYWGMLYADVNHFLNPFKTSSFPPQGNNFNKYSNSQFDELVNGAAKRPGEQQKAKYLLAQDKILEDMPFVLAYYKNTIRVSNERFQMNLNPLLYKSYKNAKRVER
jgi:oligopeptide transport system substrate-binding protein